MAKKILFPLIAIFLAYRAFELVMTLWLLSPTQVPLAIQVFFAVLVNLFITGIFAFPGFVYATSRLLGESYYRVKNERLIMDLGLVLKIGYFRKMLLLLFWGKRSNRLRFFDGTKSGLSNFEFQTRQSEFGHLAAWVSIQLVVGLILIKSHYLVAFLTTMINFIFNFYPIVLQRTHRIKIASLKRRFEGSSPQESCPKELLE
ncbi:hypothetical protein [Lunatimonas salinarum]|uniref:glycosyl-4,4'-diaponeurosporenoate acyltransferase CrtO family protein n=1 Tax=Lunatimonas salinarum TaxID=1774590 RepID=UPI003CC9122A